MKISSFNTILYSSRWLESVEFYENILNLERVAEREWFVEFKLTDSARLSIADATRATIAPGDGAGITISIAVKDLDEVHSKLCRSGIFVTQIKELWGSRVFYIHDPDNNRIEFWQ